MYFRSPGYIDAASLTKAACVLSETRPAPLSNRLLLSAGAILAPVIILLIIFCTDRVMSGL